MSSDLPRSVGDAAGLHRTGGYEDISGSYAGLVGQDPSKLFVQFPWAFHQFGEPLAGVRILDIGCGEGSLARLLARRGAIVCGYDVSPSQVQLAREAEAKEPLGVEYVVADPREIVGKLGHRRFGAAIAMNVLHYATDLEYLQAFFSSTWRLLEPGGLFAALVSSPDFERRGIRTYNRRYSREADGRLRVDFYQDGQLSCSAFYTDFSRADYEAAARATAWPALEWVPVEVTREGRRALGDFWERFEEDCPYAGFKVSKPPDAAPSA